MSKIKVPKDYYVEMTNELLTAWHTAKNNPKRQLDRIKAVIDSGKDHEVMNGRHIIPLEKLMTFYIDALKVDVEALKKRYENFKRKHEIDNTLYGDLSKAKKHVKAFCKNNPNYNDADNNYSILHDTSHKYFLNNSQMNKLMEYMMDKNWLF